VAAASARIGSGPSARTGRSPCSLRGQHSLEQALALREVLGDGASQRTTVSLALAAMVASSSSVTSTALRNFPPPYGTFRSPAYGGGNLPPSSAFALILAANEPCLNATRVASLFKPDQRRWRRCPRLNLEDKLRFDDPVQTARRCSTFPGCAKTITAQSCAALLDALISNKVAMWFGESCRPRSDQQRQRSPRSGQRRRWQRLSGGAFTSVAQNEKEAILGRPLKRMWRALTARALQ
jgi:hypothetical protein